MNLEKMSEELAKGIKTQEDLSNIMGQLTKKAKDSLMTRRYRQFPLVITL